MGSEQWPYAVASFRSAESPLRRWPALAVESELPAGSPIRAGQTLFMTQCIVCHPLNGAGNAHVGPDLNIPQNHTDYLLRKSPVYVHSFRLLRTPANTTRRQNCWPNWKRRAIPGTDEPSIWAGTVGPALHR